jgi:hypothetical protein
MKKILLFLALIAFTVNVKSQLNIDTKPTIHTNWHKFNGKIIMPNLTNKLSDTVIVMWNDTLYYTLKSQILDSNYLDGIFIKKFTQQTKVDRLNLTAADTCLNLIPLGAAGTDIALNIEATMLGLNQERGIVIKGCQEAINIIPVGMAGVALGANSKGVVISGRDTSLTARRWSTIDSLLNKYLHVTGKVQIDNNLTVNNVTTLKDTVYITNLLPLSSDTIVVRSGNALYYMLKTQLLDTSYLDDIFIKKYTDQTKLNNLSIYGNLFARDTIIQAVPSVFKATVTSFTSPNLTIEYDGGDNGGNYNYNRYAYLYYDDTYLCRGLLSTQMSGTVSQYGTATISNSMTTPFPIFNQADISHYTVVDSSQFFVVEKAKVGIQTLCPQKSLDVGKSSIFRDTIFLPNLLSLSSDTIIVKSGNALYYTLKSSIVGAYVLKSDSGTIYVTPFMNLSKLGKNDSLIYTSVYQNSLKADKTTNVSTGFGLSGGGDLSTNRTHIVDSTIIMTKYDTLTLSDRINLKLNTSDTTSKWLPLTGTASNSDSLNHQQSSYYIDTSGTAQTKRGSLTITGNITGAKFITANGGELLIKDATGADSIRILDNGTNALFNTDNPFIFNNSGTITTSVTVPSVIGGTGSGSTLTFKNTTASGTTATAVAQAFNVGDNGAVNAMNILNNGNVCIGTNSSTNRLQINGAAANQTGINATCDAVSTGIVGGTFAFGTHEIFRGGAIGSAGGYSIYGLGGQGLGFWGVTTSTTPTYAPIYFSAGSKGVATSNIVAMGATEKCFTFYNSSTNDWLGANLLTMYGGSFVINEGSIDYDTRIETNGDVNTLFIDGGTDRIGIKTGTPSYDLSFAGTAAQTIGMEANAATTAGQNLTIKAGSNTSGTTANLQGGMLTLQSGIAKDTSFASIRLQRNIRGITSNGTLNTLTDALIIPSTKNLVDTRVITLFIDSLAGDSVAGGTFKYSISVNNADVGRQTESGVVIYSAAKYMGVWATSVITEVSSNQALTSGSLASTWTITPSAGVSKSVQIKVSVDSSLDPAAGEMWIGYNLDHTTNGFIIQQ